MTAPITLPHSLRMLVVTLVAVAGSLAAYGAEACPELVATFTSHPGYAGEIYAGQRVEMRHCPVDPATGFGTFQLVAWERDAQQPSLVYEVDGATLNQMAMIEGVYAFVIGGSLAARVVVITFENGSARVALEQSSRLRIELASDGKKLEIDVYSRKVSKEHYEFPRLPWHPASPTLKLLRK